MAGKPTLFDTLTEANTYISDQLFATLDPTLSANWNYLSWGKLFW